jgi:hypothetical protein
VAASGTIQFRQSKKRDRDGSSEIRSGRSVRKKLQFVDGARGPSSASSTFAVVPDAVPKAIESVLIDVPASMTELHTADELVRERKIKRKPIRLPHLVIKKSQVAPNFLSSSCSSSCCSTSRTPTAHRPSNSLADVHVPFAHLFNSGPHPPSPPHVHMQYFPPGIFELTSFSLSFSLSLSSLPLLPLSPSSSPRATSPFAALARQIPWNPGQVTLAFACSRPQVALGGLGVFANEAIPKGSWVTEYGGEVISYDEASRRRLLGEDTHIRSLGVGRAVSCLDSRLRGTWHLDYYKKHHMMGGILNDAHGTDHKNNCECHTAQHHFSITTHRTPHSSTSLAESHINFYCSSLLSHTHEHAMPRESRRVLKAVSHCFVQASMYL